MKNLVSGADFHNFETSPVFVGMFTGETVKREKDADGSADDANKKAGAIMGYVFEDKNGNLVNIGNSYLIAKAIEQIKSGDWLRIEFTGKAKNSKGQPVNRYKIDQLEPADIEKETSEAQSA